MSIDSLTDTIMRAALDAEVWTEVQLETERYLGAHASQIATADHANGNAFYSRSTRFSEIDAHFAQSASLCEPVRYAAARPNWRRFVDYDYIDEYGMSRSWFYRECERFDIKYRLAVRLTDTETTSKALLWFWPGRSGPAQGPELQKLTAIEAQLRLSATVADELGASIESERALVDGLDAAKVAAAIMEPDGAVLHANRSAEELLSADDGLKIECKGRIAAMHRDSADRLGRVLRHAGQALRSAEPCGGKVLVQRPSGKTPYVVTIVPLAFKHQLFGPGRPILLTLFADPAGLTPLPDSVLRKCFDLTHAESSVAVLFAEGYSTSEIADQRGVSRETVRSQMKCLMSKTGVRRQAELMRLFLPFFTC